MGSNSILESLMSVMVLDALSIFLLSLCIPGLMVPFRPYALHHNVSLKGREQERDIVAIEAVKLIISYNFGIEEYNNIMQIKSATSFHHTKHCKRRCGKER